MSQATVNLAWSAPTTDKDGNPVPANSAQGYGVYRGPSVTGPFTKIATVGATPAFADVGVADGVDFYTVTAINADGVESAQCTPVQAVVNTPTPVLSAPTGLTATTTFA